MEMLLTAMSVLGLICTCFLSFFTFQFVRAYLPNINNYLEKTRHKQLKPVLCVILPVLCALAVLL